MGVGATASLLWRLRRATAVESDLFEIEANDPVGFGQTSRVDPTSREIVYAVFRQKDAASIDRDLTPGGLPTAASALPKSDPNYIASNAGAATRLGHCFLRLTNLPRFALDRLSRYDRDITRSTLGSFRKSSRRTFFELTGDHVLRHSWTIPRLILNLMPPLAQVPLQVRTILRNIRRIVWGPGSIKSAAFEQEVLCPAEFEELNPAIFLPGQIDKIQATAAGSQLSTEIENLKKRSVRHAPTIGYHIRDATLLNGSLYAGNLRHMVFEKESKSPSSGHSGHAILAKAALASTFLGAKYFGHWLKDDCLQYMLAEEYSQPLCLKHSYYQHAPEYAQYFSQNWTPSESARIDHLIVFQDFGQNSLKRRRYGTLRSRIEACMPSGNRTPLVYLRRGQPGTVRLIENESEIMDLLARRGFEIVDISSTPLVRLLSFLLSAKLVVSIEGSHLAHCWPSVENPTSVLTLQPPDRFISVYRGRVSCMSGDFGMVVGDGRRGHYSFSISDILRTIDLMLVRAA